MTRCVQMQDVGVLAQTSASPADTSAVDEPVWISATFMKGERVMHVHVHLHSDNQNRIFVTQGNEGGRLGGLRQDMRT